MGPGRGPGAMAQRCFRRATSHTGSLADTPPRTFESSDRRPGAVSSPESAPCAQRTRTHAATELVLVQTAQVRSDVRGGVLTLYCVCIPLDIESGENQQRFVTAASQHVCTRARINRPVKPSGTSSRIPGNVCWAFGRALHGNAARRERVWAVPATGNPGVEHVV